VARVFKPVIGADWIVGVVGALQFDVLADRIRTEYEVPVHFEQTELYTARWVYAETGPELKKFEDSNRTAMASDHEESPVFMARNAWHLNHTQDENKSIKFMATKEGG